MTFAFTARVAAAAMMAFMLIGELAPAKAEASFGLYIGRPGFSLYIDRAPRYRYSPYPYYNPYYSPQPSYRSGRCDYWRARCGQNWGFGGRNYRGCLRYHGCL